MTQQYFPRAIGDHRLVECVECATLIMFDERTMQAHRDWHASLRPAPAIEPMPDWSESETGRKAKRR